MNLKDYFKKYKKNDESKMEIQNAINMKLSELVVRMETAKLAFCLA
jgi:hypothetical protein